MADRSVSLDILFGGRDVGLGSAAGGAQAKMQKLGMTLTRVGAAATAVGGAITAMAYKSVQAASNLSEAMNKSEVVFGDNADAIEEWADTAADSMGMSKRAALDAGASLGNFFMNMDVGADKATDMSKEMVQLGADLASFHNLAGGAEEGLQKLQSGLAGEIEPMRRLGIVINASAVEAKALEMGLADASGEISESAKVQARYAMIMEQTSREQGDFERTSDQLANSQRRMKAKVEDATASIGQSLQPALLAVLNVAEPLIKSIGEFAKTPVGKVAIQVAAGFGALALALGPVLMLVGQLLPIITALQGAGGIAGLGGALTGLSGVITSTVVPAMSALGASLLAVAPYAIAIAAIAAVAYELYLLKQAYNEATEAAEEMAEATQQTEEMRKREVEEGYASEEVYQEQQAEIEAAAPTLEERALGMFVGKGKTGYDYARARVQAEQPSATYVTEQRADQAAAVNINDQRRREQQKTEVHSETTVNLDGETVAKNKHVQSEMSRNAQREIENAARR